MDHVEGYFDIVLIRRKSGECDALCYGSGEEIWMARFGSAESMATKIKSLPGSWHYRIREFADKAIYPDHLAGAISNIAVNEDDLKSVGFTHYRRS